MTQHIAKEDNDHALIVGKAAWVTTSYQKGLFRFSYYSCQR